MSRCIVSLMMCARGAYRPLLAPTAFQSCLHFPDRRASPPATVPPLVEFNGGYIANPVDGDLTQPTPPERGQMGQLLSAALSPKSGASLIK